jgi:hypothetical protein
VGEVLPPWTPRSSSVVRVRMLRRHGARVGRPVIASVSVVFMVCSLVGVISSLVPW